MAGQSYPLLDWGDADLGCKLLGKGLQEVGGPTPLPTGVGCVIRGGGALGLLWWDELIGDRVGQEEGRGHLAHSPLLFGVE